LYRKRYLRGERKIKTLKGVLKYKGGLVQKIGVPRRKKLGTTCGRGGWRKKTGVECG